MYIMIFEDGTIGKTENITNDDKRSCDDGYLSVIDISDPENPKDYYDGEWRKLDKLD